jgi:hypothetical protein
LKRAAYLAAAALVALLILAPAAMAQGTQGPMMTESIQMQKTQPLPSSGGPAVSSLLLPAAALLVGSGVLAYAVVRRRR